MDKQLVDNLIKVVLDDMGHVNSYEHLEDLLLTLTDEDINYFLNSCDEEVFTNFNLSWLLVRTIPLKMKKFAETFVQKKMDAIDMLENSLRKEYSKKRITEELFEETIKEYDNVRAEANAFMLLYMSEIEKELKKDKHE